jgi:hypothetical protein
LLSAKLVKRQDLLSDKKSSVKIITSWKAGPCCARSHRANAPGNSVASRVFQEIIHPH